MQKYLSLILLVLLFKNDSYSSDKDKRLRIQEALKYLNNDSCYSWFLDRMLPLLDEEKKIMLEQMAKTREQSFATTFGKDPDHIRVMILLKYPIFYFNFNILSLGKFTSLQAMIR